jgi:hypothetical protein
MPVVLFLHTATKNRDSFSREYAKASTDNTKHELAMSSHGSCHNNSSDDGGSSGSIETTGEKEIAPSDDDVLLGRGTKHHLHPGNQRYNGKAKDCRLFTYKAPLCAVLTQSLFLGMYISVPGAKPRSVH